MPVQLLHVIRCETAQGGGAYHAIWHKCSTCQGVRGAPRPAHYAKTVNIEIICDCSDILGGVRHVPAVTPAGARVAGPVVADQADTEPVEQWSAGPWAIEAARCTVEQEHRCPVWVT